MSKSMMTFNFLLVLQTLFIRSLSFEDYANEFVSPDYILADNIPSTTWQAQETIVQWVEELAGLGPWSVTNKSVPAPSGDIHDYLSWSPYWWPDCSSVHNTTSLTPEQVWVTCPYTFKDGQRNPDVRTVIDDIGSFLNMSDAVLYNSVAWALNKSNSIYSQNAVRYIDTWFLNPNTKMNPNLNFGQVIRGTNKPQGSSFGVLDLECIAKVVSGILILRKGQSQDWTSELDSQMVSWGNSYLNWLTTNKLALQEQSATNNHGTFYYNQVAALNLLVNNPGGATTATNAYFSNQFLHQISANGEQPTEASRTRPYHYRNFNLGGMIVNAKIATFVNPKSNVWHKETSAGSTIQTAVDFMMTIDPSKSNEENVALEAFPNVAAVAAAYGDPAGKYAKWLANANPEYATEGYFLWDQPLQGGTAKPLNISIVSNSTGPSSPVSMIPNAGYHAGVSTYLLWTGVFALLLGLLTDYDFTMPELCCFCQR